MRISVIFEFELGHKSQIPDVGRNERTTKAFMGFGKDRAEKIKEQELEAKGKREWQRQTAPIFETKADPLWEAPGKQLETEVNEFSATRSEFPNRKLKFTMPGATLVSTKKTAFPQHSLTVRLELAAT